MNSAIQPSPPATDGKLAERRVVAFAAYFGAYYLLAVFASLLAVQPRYPHFIWPADGLALGALLVLPAGRWPLVLGLTALANVVAGLQAGSPAAHVAIAAALNVAEPLVAAVGLTRLAGPRVRIDSVRSLAAFLVAFVPLVAALSSLEALVASVRHGLAFRGQWTISFVSDFVGMILVAPLVLAWSRHGWREALADVKARLPELGALLTGLLVTAHFLFGAQVKPQDYVPALTYLCAPFLIWAALRFGLRASTLGLALFGIICYWHTGNGFGPFSTGGGADWTSFLHLQGYLATIVVTTLFAAALLVERQEAAKATEAWRRRYEAVIRASGNLVYELDPATGTVLWDGDTRAILGVAPEAIAHLGQWMARVHPDDRMRLRTLWDRLVSGELPEVAIEYRVRRDGGEYITVGVNGYAIEGPARRIIGFVKDISDKVRAEEERSRLAAQLRQAEKMEAVGHLAGGIAHDFNNILGAILGYGELAQLKAGDADMRRYIDTIMNAGNRAKALVTQILAYSRAEGGERSPVIVLPIAQEVADLVRGSTPHAIEVRFAPGAEEAAVLGDPTRMHQLLMNLSTNAVQAMDQGGTLAIEIAEEVLEAPRKTRSGTVSAGEYVRIAVSDTSHGIPPEAIDRIFEPFFTTKRAGRGTGLGLALVHSVVKEHQGFIDVESAVGRGTTFTVWLPRIAAAAMAESAAAEPAHGQGQVVLAVDDEAQVLAALEEMLASLGYEPAGFASSREALEAVRADPRRFDAVVSDEVMPEMTGTQLAKELRALNPTLPIVIATGYGGAGFETRAISAGVNRVLRKPYKMGDIGEALAGIFARG